MHPTLMTSMPSSHAAAASQSRDAAPAAARPAGRPGGSTGAWLSGLALALLPIFGAGCVLELTEPVPVLDRDGDGFEALRDCDDGDASVGPRFLDGDNDGFGDA